METFAWLTVLSAILSLICLLTLHLVSPEYQPSWRMISEYALGKFKWLITCFFSLWGLSSVFISLLLFKFATNTAFLIGIILLLVSAIGEILGALFDVKHKHHGLAFLLGVPSLPVAALLISYNLPDAGNWNQHSLILKLSAHSAWLSLLIMAMAMGLMFSGFKKAGIPMDKNSIAPEKVPDGVIALAGYANRLLVFCYVFWLIVVAACYLLTAKQ